MHPLLAFFLSFFYEWWDRKITARIQKRIGPTYGPFGIFQPFYDFLKLLQKEEIEIKGTNNLLIITLLLLAASSLLLSFVFIPSPFFFIEFKGDIVVIVFLSSFSFFLLGCVAYLIPSPFSAIGSGRILQQIISFEIPFLLSIATVICFTESFSFTQIHKKQVIPFILLFPIAFFVYIYSCLGKLEFAPFSIPHAETEIAGGWKVELNSRLLAIVRICKNLEHSLFCILGSILFLGGGGFLILLIKSFVLSSFIILLKNTTARYRIDQALKVFWEKIIPLSLIQIIIVALLK